MTKKEARELKNLIQRLDAARPGGVPSVLSKPLSQIWLLVSDLDDTTKSMDAFEKSTDLAKISIPDCPELNGLIAIAERALLIKLGFLVA